MDRRIQRLVTLIESNPAQKLSLVGMARLVHLSPSRLRHRFKSEIGITPTVYLQRARMRKAAELLQSEDLSIKEVRAAIGLYSDSYFSHLFKRSHGLPPSRLKNL